jgi:hypothetical protein
LAVQVYLPIGQYFPDRLINLGSNRFTIRSQLGLAHHHGKWDFEAYAGVWFFTVNPDFWGGQELKQDPLLTAKVHVIRTLPKRIWLAIDAGYANGGDVYVNGSLRDSHISTIRLGGTFAIPLANKHTLKLFGFSTIRFDKGSDYDLIALAYQFRWGGK